MNSCCYTILHDMLIFLYYPNLPISYSFLEVDVDTLIVGSSMAFLPVEVQAVETVRMKWQLSFLYHQSWIDNNNINVLSFLEIKIPVMWGMNITKTIMKNCNIFVFQCIPIQISDSKNIGTLLVKLFVNRKVKPEESFVIYFMLLFIVEGWFFCLLRPKLWMTPCLERLELNALPQLSELSTHIFQLKRQKDWFSDFQWYHCFVKLIYWHWRIKSYIIAMLKTVTK